MVSDVKRLSLTTTIQLRRLLICPCPPLSHSCYTASHCLRNSDGKGLDIAPQPEDLTVSEASAMGIKCHSREHVDGSQFHTSTHFHIRPRSLSSQFKDSSSNIPRYQTNTRASSPDILTHWSASSRPNKANHFFPATTTYNARHRVPHLGSRHHISSR